MCKGKKNTARKIRKCNLANNTVVSCSAGHTESTKDMLRLCRSGGYLTRAMSHGLCQLQCLGPVNRAQARAHEWFGLWK